MVSEHLREVAEGSYAATGKYAIGVYIDKAARTAVLIDSGPPSSRVLKEIVHDLQAAQHQIVAVVNTHGHLVNAGGNRFLKTKLPNLKVFAAHMAALLIDHPSLEANIFGGGLQDRDSNDGEVAETGVVTDIVPYHDGTIYIHDIAFKIVTLPGHSPGMIGVITPDDVLYCGDAAFGEETLNRQEWLLYTDTIAAKKSLEKLQRMKKKAYVLYHGGTYDNISKLVKRHLSMLKETANFIVEAVSEQPRTLEQLTQRAMKRFALDDHLKLYNLTAMTIRAHLSELQQAGRIHVSVKEGWLQFSKA